MLLGLRGPAQSAPEILVINSPRNETAESLLEPSSAASVLMSLVEMQAKSLIIQTPVLGLSTPSSGDEEEILRRFDEEFSLLGANIRRLFEGIRLGSVSPTEAASYVSALVELSESGKERLVSAYLDRSQEGLARLQKAAAVFGELRQPSGLKVEVIGRDARPIPMSPRADAPDTEDYFHAVPDKDGVLRRVAPALRTAEGAYIDHIVYRVLQEKWTGVKRSGRILGPSLKIERSPGDTISIPLDTGGAIIVEKPGGENGFRKINLSSFLAYNDEDRVLRKVLEDASNLGIFRDVRGEENPLILYDYALDLREELIEDPAPEKKYEWINARNNYLKYLEAFVYSPAEMQILSETEIALAEKALDDDGYAALNQRRDALIETFRKLKESFRTFSALRKDLDRSLAGAFCILGPENTDTEASAFLANALITGRSIKAWPFPCAAALAVLWVLLVCACLCRLSAAKSGLLGLVFIVAGTSGCVFLFVLSGNWFDPLPQLAATLLAVVVSFCYAFGIKRGERRRFSQAYSAVVPPACLGVLLRQGQWRMDENTPVWAAVVAIKDPELIYLEDGEQPGIAGRSILTFQQNAAEFFRRAGAVIIGCEGDLVMGCFGSPLERLASQRGRGPSPYADGVHAKQFPASEAWAAVREMLRFSLAASWRFAVDAGECVFNWSRLSGYHAFGRPVLRARILANLSPRYKSRVIVSSKMNELLSDLTVRKLDALRTHNGGPPEPFFEPVLR
ncbi:MAG: hypothetical protein LBR16_09085 [Treponema sp.]|nr:hypothetical protein [Treponema sp.]